jgi:hypothetical protein
MSSTSLANKHIALLRDVPGVTPLERDQYGKWAIHAISTDRRDIPENYLSPHRQDFYKVMLIVKANVIFTIGMRMFHIDGPTVIFIPPDAIISCKNISGHSLAHHCLFKKHFAEGHPVLKAAMTRYRLFSESDKNVIRLTSQEFSILTPMFLQLQETEARGGPFAEDTMQRC